MAYNTLRKFFCHFKRLYFDLHWSHSYPCKIPNLTWGVYHTILHLQPTFFSIYGVKIDAKLYMTNLFSFIFPVVLTSFIIWDLLCYGTSSYCLEVYHQNVKIAINNTIFCLYKPNSNRVKHSRLTDFFLTMENVIGIEFN